MSLRITVAAPFRQKGAERLAENEFVVALSLDRDWFSPDQATRLVDVATGRGLLDRSEGYVEITFDPTEIEVPDGFVPDEEIIQQRSPFEQALSTLADEGIEKQAAVAGINRLQSELGVTIEVAAVVFARRNGVALDDVARQAREGLAEE